MHLQRPDTLATFAASGGYGFTEAVLGQQDRHHRLAGRLALALHPVEALSFGAYVGGYRDQHTGDAGSDDSIVGDYGLFILARLAHIGALRLGASADVWGPAGDTAGPTLRALSPSATLHAQIDLGRLALLARVGYLHDRSRRTIPAGRAYLPGDQVSLGVTSADALLMGLGATGRVGALELYGELSIDLLVRRVSVPLGASRSAAVAGAMLHLARRYQLGGELQLNLGRYPQVRADRFYRVEPRVSLLLLFAARLGALPSDGGSDERGVNARPGSLRGIALHPDGTPSAGVRVHLESTGEAPAVVAEATTGADGAFVLSDVAPGEYDLVVRAEGRHDVRSRQVVDGDVVVGDVHVGTYARALRGRVRVPPTHTGPTLVRVLGGADGAEVTRAVVDADGAFQLEGLPPHDLTLLIEGEGLATQRVQVPAEQSGQLEPVVLQPRLPDGEIRGTVLGLRGVPVAARVRVQPGDFDVTTDAEGRFTVLTEPGSYTVQVEAEGYRSQERRVVVEERGVVVLEVLLRSAP